MSRNIALSRKPCSPLRVIPCKHSFSCAPDSASRLCPRSCFGDFTPRVIFGYSPSLSNQSKNLLNAAKYSATVEGFAPLLVNDCLKLSSVSRCGSLTPFNCINVINCIIPQRYAFTVIAETSRYAKNLFCTVEDTTLLNGCASLINGVTADFTDCFTATLFITSLSFSVGFSLLNCENYITLIINCQTLFTA